MHLEARLFQQDLALEEVLQQRFPPVPISPLAQDSHHRRRRQPNPKIAVLDRQETNMTTKLDAEMTAEASRRTRTREELQAIAPQLRSQVFLGVTARATTGCLLGQRESLCQSTIVPEPTMAETVARRLPSYAMLSIAKVPALVQLVQIR